MKYNNKSLKVNEWTTKKLKDEALAVWHSVYVVDCYGTGDMILLGLIEQELHKRGYTFADESQLTIIKD